MTRGAAKQTGAMVSEVHGANKPLDPDLKPEKNKDLQKQVFTQPANVNLVDQLLLQLGLHHLHLIYPELCHK